MTVAIALVGCALCFLGGTLVGYASALRHFGLARRAAEIRRAVDSPN